MNRFLQKGLIVLVTTVILAALTVSSGCKDDFEGDEDEESPITVESFGGSGTGDGQFGNNPHGIDVGDDGRVYVSDTGNNRIQKFTPNGVFVTKWSCTQPYGLVVHQDRVYVCSIPSTVKVYLLDGSEYDSWSVPDVNNRSGGMAAVDIDVDNDGIFYVLDNIDRAVKKFNSSGTFMSSFRVDGVDKWEWGPLSIVVASGQVFVTDSCNHKVNVWTTAGTYVRTIGSQGNQNGQFTNPSGIALMNNSTIIVGDISPSPVFARIQSFSLSGAFKNAIKPDSGGFYPVAMAMNPGKTKIYLCYSGSFKIRILDTF